MAGGPFRAVHPFLLYLKLNIFLSISSSGANEVSDISCSLLPPEGLLFSVFFVKEGGISHFFRESFLEHRAP